MRLIIPWILSNGFIVCFLLDEYLNKILSIIMKPAQCAFAGFLSAMPGSQPVLGSRVVFIVILLYS